ncbi:BPI fold-containing family A member 2-like [Macrotis lagotis]|uniref:BPI fold-containing family A member 2-like n=1 Tax=Macrotis lagotis TaxID=92651 RepID=UPI003D6985EA
MLALWRLTLLCGLLVSPSCCLLEGLQSLVKKETAVVTNDLQGLANGLVQELEKLRLTPLGKLVDGVLGDVRNFVDNSVNIVLSKLEKIFVLKIEDLVKLNIKPELDADGKSLVVRVPVSGTIALKLNPFTSELVKVKVNVDILLKIHLGIDDKTGASIVVLGDCSSDPATVDISLLEGTSKIQLFLMKDLTGILNKLIPLAMEKQVCPAVGNLVKSLDVNKIKDLISQLQTNAQVDVSKVQLA